MSIFEFSHYRDFLKSRIVKLPNQGRGEASRMARHLGVHSTLLSLILSGERELTLEQGFDLTDFLGLTELESEYFILLIQSARAGSVRYKAFVKKKMASVRESANKIVNRFEHDMQLTEEQRSIFYSSWLYSAVRLFASTNVSGVSLDQIQEKFRLARVQTLSILEFLISCGLVRQSDGAYLIGTHRTFLEQGSPHLLKHHSNWRIKAIQKSDRLDQKELMFTSPVSISSSDFEKVREEIAELLKRFSKTVKESPAEDIACLNIDLFWIDEK